MNKHDTLTLLARIIIGGIFAYAGWLKVSDMAMVISSFEPMGLNAIVAYAVSYGELLGGIALVLGLYARAAALGLAIIMAGAVYFTWGMGFQVYSSPLGLLGGLFALAAAGAGSYTIRFGR
jgi:putative oxidoreductase